MEFGWYHEFHRQVDQQSDADAFAQALEQVADAERWELDAIWLAEIHQQATRSVLSAPLTVASAIAGRTSRIKIGTAVQVLPLCHPLRLAEETATIDQISRGRLLLGAGTQRQPPILCRLRRAVFGEPRTFLRNTRYPQARLDSAELFLRGQVSQLQRGTRSAAAISNNRTHRSVSPVPARTPSRCSANSAIRCLSRCAAARCRHWRRT